MLKELKKITKKYNESFSLVKQTYKRNAILVPTGTIMLQNYYVDSGILKCCVYNEEVQKEAIIDLLSTGDAILPFRTPTYIMPMPFNIQVIEDAVIYSISSDIFEALKEKEPILQELMQLDLQRIFTRFPERFKINVYPDILTRYEKLLEMYPFLNSVSDKDVAAIIGTDRTTINRIRAERNKKT